MICLFRNKSLLAQRLKQQLDQRIRLSMDDYESLFEHNTRLGFGTKECETDMNVLPRVADQMKDRHYIVLREIKNFHIKYEWL